MKEFDTGRLNAHYKRLSDRIRALMEVTHINQIPTYAAHACYFMVLAAFPMLLLVLSVLRYTALQVEDLIALLRGVVPAALMSAVQRLVISTYENTSTAVVSVSALATLWSASRSIYGLVIGLNAIYGVRENRGYLFTRSMSVLYMFLFLVVLLLTLLLQVFGQAISAALPVPDYPFFAFLADVVNSRHLLLLLLQTALFTAMYSALPNKRNPPVECLPGAVLTSVGWQTFSVVFSVYVDNFAAYANIYGSVYAVVLCMLWLYCCIFIIFLGGAFNRFLAWYRQEKK